VKGRPVVLVSAACVGLVLVAVVMLLVASRMPKQATAPAPSPHASVSAAPVTATTAGLPASVPTHLSIPAIQVNHDLGVVGQNPDGTIQVPPLNDVALPAWYHFSPTPGQLGPAVVVGHIDSAQAGKGVFYDLGALRPGDTISVQRKDGRTVSFSVYSVEEYPKTSFPTQKVYGNTTDAELRLITCGGAFNPAAHSYDDNIVVYARML
jgi:sortase (surface protein transpeptidase)